MSHKPPNKKTRLPTDPALIISMVLDDLGLTLKELHSKQRLVPLPMARSLITHALRSGTDLSYPEIAIHLNSKNHSTPMTAFDRVEAGDYDQEIKVFVPEAINAQDYTRWIINRAAEHSQSTPFYSRSTPQPDAA
jgi:hypothetical protein